MKHQRILVTGGAGFIASHIVDAYLERGCRVFVADDLSRGDRGNVNPSAELIERDFADPSVLDLIEREKIELLNHHAAQIDVRISVADPANDAETNIVASLRLLERAASAGVKRVVFASSGGAIYGEPQFTPQSEDHPVAPLSPYGCSKLSLEHYLDYYRTVRGLSAVSLRYANVYGPRQRCDGEAGVVAIFARRMLNREEIEINGDGNQTRDFVFVEDLVRANVAVSESDLEGSFNVGTGVETTINALFDEMRRALGYRGDAVHRPAKLGEQVRSVLDGSRLRKAAGLPAPVGLADGLRETLEWFRGR